jgi:hypothetical protein
VITYRAEKGSALTNAEVDANFAQLANGSIEGFLQSGGTARSWLSKAREIVSVKDFGVAGDGTTDDTTKIQAAIDTVGAAGGGSLFFPRGIYQVSSPIKVRYDYVALQGEVTGQPFTFGAATQGGTIIRAKSGFSGSHIVQIAQDSPTRYLVNCAIQNIAVGGFNATSANGIYWMVTNGFIRNCFLSGMGVGIKTEGLGFGGLLAPYDCFISDTKIQSVEGNGIEFYNNSSDFRLTNVIVTDTGANGIYFDATADEVAGPGTQMLGCYIYTCVGKAVYAKSPWQMEFFGNRFMDCNGGIYMDTSPANFGGAGFKIVGNVFRNCSVDTDNTTDAINITMDNVVRGGLISDNSFYTDAGLVNTSYNRMRYGINIANSNMNNVTIGPMSQGYVTAATSCFGTAPINDAGTNTVIAGGLDSGLKLLNKYGNGVMDLTGTGDPEGAVTAPVGSIFRRSDGGADSTIYIKESGSGDTGWVPI